MTQAQIAAYLAQHPDADPAHNPQLHALVHSPNYQDRGLHGPLGGKGGTVSQPWCEEYERINSGGVSALGLMTIIESQMPAEILSVPLEQPDDIYPKSCRTPEDRRAWELSMIEEGIGLPPLRFLPEG